jgi:membrane protein
MRNSNASSQEGARRHEPGRWPWQIPLKDWWAILWRIGREMFRDHIFLVSSGVAFLAILALLPVIFAVISVYGLVTSTQALEQQMHSLGSIMPEQLVHLLGNNLKGLTQDSGLALGLGIFFSIASAIWVSVRGMLGLIGALNIVHEEHERRSVPALTMTATALAVGALIFWIFALFLVIGAPYLLQNLSPHTPVIHVVAHVVRWLLIVLTVLISMAVLYRFGPSHKEPRWQWISVGTTLATLLWILGSLGLMFYLNHYGSLGNIYGSLGILLVVQIWFWLTAFVFLLGAEFNVEIQHQTKHKEDG